MSISSKIIKAILSPIDSLKKVTNFVVNSAPFKAFHFVASATVGIPIALASSVFLLSAAVVLQGMDLCYSHTIKNSVFGKALRYNPLLHSLSEGSYNALGAVWSGFGLYSIVKTAEYMSDSLRSFNDRVSDSSKPIPTYQEKRKQDQEDKKKKEESERKILAKIKEKEEKKKKPSSSVLNAKADSLGFIGRIKSIFGLGK